jgi:acyl-CoA reductase-like NAD-dependent aldehyde dehydrogenase
MSLRSLNPTDGRLIREYPEASSEEVTAALRAARDVFPEWRRRAFAGRARPLERAGELLRERRDS